MKAAVLPRTQALCLLSILSIACGSSQTPARPDSNVEAASKPAATADVLRGEQLLSRGQVDSAWAIFEEAIAKNPQDARAWLDLGLVHEEVGDWAAAERAYRRSTEIDGDFAEAYNNLGVLLRERGELADAIPMLERAAALDPQLGPARFNLALAYEDAGDTNAAEREYLRAIEAMPDDPIPRINLAMLYLDAGRKERAENLLRTVAPMVRGDVLLSVAVGGALRRTGAPREAARVLEDALSHASDPPPTDLLAELALAHYASGDLEEAERTMRQAVAQEPKNPALAYALGTILVKRGSLEEGRKYLRRVVSLDDDGTYAARAREQLRSLK
jgi:Flp pilus assembly protein TadD